jgi:hypothetical protein
MVRTAWVAGLIALMLAPEASAAMCVRLSTRPTQPVVGTRTVVQLETFYPEPHGRLTPWAVRDYPFRVEAVSPSSRVHRVVVRLSADVYAWRGSFRFTQQGSWTLRVTNFGPAYPKGCAEVHRVRVLAPRR